MIEVSIRQPCQVTAISPGRSATQAAPSARSATSARKMMTRIIAGLWPYGVAFPSAPMASAASWRLVSNGRDARLRLVDPGLGRRAHGRRQLREIGERARARPRDAAFTSMRVMIAAGSSPEVSSAGRMRTRRPALFFRRSKNPPSAGMELAARAQRRHQRGEFARERRRCSARRIAAKGSSAANALSGASGRAAASSAANGSPRSTAAAQSRSRQARGARRGRW